MKKRRLTFFVGLLILCCLCSSCAIYLPIPKIEKYYPPTQETTIITEVHNDMIYIGKLKVVPSDNSFSFNKKRATKVLIKKAKKYGARFVFIKGINTTSSDYVFIPWDWTWGDGVTIEAELYY